jgi:hypothetical protein
MTDQAAPAGAFPLGAGPDLPGPDLPGPDFPGPGSWLSVEESARLVSGWALAERRLYEVLGNWVSSVSDPTAKIYFDTCSQHHAWRQHLWEERLPGLPAHLVPSYDGTPTAIDALAAVEGDVERLSAYCRAVLPRVVVGYRWWQGRCSGSADRPAARALGFALVDVLADWERGSSLLTEYLGGEAGEQAAAAAADACRQVDRALARQHLLPR